MKELLYCPVTCFHLQTPTTPARPQSATTRTSWIRRKTILVHCIVPARVDTRNDVYPCTPRRHLPGINIYQREANTTFRPRMPQRHCERHDGTLIAITAHSSPLRHSLILHFIFLSLDLQLSLLIYPPIHVHVKYRTKTPRHYYRKWLSWVTRSFPRFSLKRGWRGHDVPRVFRCPV